jgi:hypothetical protein
MSSPPTTATATTTTTALHPMDPARVCVRTAAATAAAGQHDKPAPANHDQHPTNGIYIYIYINNQAAASEWREACVCLLPRLPLSLTVAGVGVGALLRLAYCWAPLWAAVAFVLLPSLAQVTTTSHQPPALCAVVAVWVWGGGRSHSHSCVRACVRDVT